jgi:hypothetical protein
MAHVPRLDCRCPCCRRGGAAAGGDAGDAGLTTAAGAVDAALADLLRRAGGRPSGFPPELALGNVVRLKRPYWGRERHPHRDEPFAFGIIAQQLHATGGVPVVSVWLYDEAGRLYLHAPSQVPVYVDLPASELVLHKVAAECGYRTVNRDLYPQSDGEGTCT